jgi:hypothetical protein
MLLNKKFTKLETSKLFKEWRKDNPKSYLAHVFRMFDEANEKIWQFGYYNDDNTITTFILEDDVKEVPHQEIFQKEKHKLEKLDVKKIKLDFSKALAKAQGVHSKKYSKHPIMKKIVILQTLDKKQVYNITFVTQTMHTLNVHVDSSSGKILREELISLMDIAKIDDKKPSYIG